MKPQMIRIGNLILNLANVQYMVVEGPNLVNVYFTSGVAIKYSDEEAQALVESLDAGYVTEVSAHGAGARRARAQAAQSS